MKDLDETATPPRDTRDTRDAMPGDAASLGLRATLGEELESPLGAALGYADLVLEAGASEGDRRKLEAIRRHGQRLLELVRELGASERSGAAARTSEIEANPRATIELLVDEYRPLCEERHLRLWMDVRPILPTRAYFDSLRLRQALRILLENSVRFTREGMVGVRAGWRAPDRGEIEVIDSSSGPSLQEFERLARALDASPSGDAPSSAHGVGLALARRIARAMGGDLEYERAPNARGVYRLRFALRPLENEPRGRPQGWLRMATPRLTGRVLLADACGETRYLLRRILEEVGLEVATAETGRGAVDAALHGGFDLVLLGLEMPVMDGFGAIAALRHVGCNAPVIALAAPEDAGLRERSRTFGFGAFLLKPLDRMTLLELVARHVRGRISRVRSTSANA